MHIDPQFELVPDEGDDQLQESSRTMHLSGWLKPWMGWLTPLMERCGRRLNSQMELMKR
jgi:hypothetical protein